MVLVRNNSSDPPKQLQMKKESGDENMVMVSIPFAWESQPGTPRVKLSETPLPPLTPPPSYFCSPAKEHLKTKNRKHKLLYTLFPKRKSTLPSSPAHFSSSSSSSWSSHESWNSRPDLYSVPSSPMVATSKYEYPPRLSEEHDDDSPNPTLCFGGGRASARSAGGWYSSFIKVLVR